MDGTLCPACGGRMRIIAALTDEVSTRHYLKGVGLPAEPPPIAPARPPPQRELELLWQRPTLEASPVPDPDSTPLEHLGSHGHLR